MKTSLIHSSLLLILVTVIACEKKQETSIKSTTPSLLEEIKANDEKLFNLLKSGNVREAFAMHKNSTEYQNIAEGTKRNYSVMDSVLKMNAANNIKAYDYKVVSRDFLIINDSNVIETIEADRKLINELDSAIENRQVVLSVLWTKSEANWLVGYIHSSYKEKVQK